MLHRPRARQGWEINPLPKLVNAEAVMPQWWLEIFYPSDPNES